MRNTLKTGDKKVTGPTIAVAPEPLITAEEAAAFMGCSARALKRKAERGEVPAMKSGKRWMFRASLLDAWCQRKLMSNCSEEQGERKGA